MLKTFKTRKEFYNSTLWQEIKTDLWNKRRNNNGEVICEHCKKPILMKHEARLHHKEELTDNNLNDWNISTNYNNLAWLHHRCHDELHFRFGKIEKKVYLIVGSPCSGKSSLVESMATKEDIILDFDKLCSAITINPIHIKSPRILPIAFALRKCFLEQMKMSKNKNNEWVNCYIISSEPIGMKRKNEIIIPYGVDETIIMDTTREECLQRLNKQNDNRDIELYTKLINNFYDRFSYSE